MRVLLRIALSVAAGIVLTAAPLSAQTARGYITGFGGFAVSADATSGSVIGEAGARIAPHLLAFGDLGCFQNLQPSDAQPAVDNTLALLSADQGLSVAATARVPATFTLGGLRFEVPTHSRLSPYVLGGIGVARLKPTAEFTFSSGALPDGSTPTPGDDVTSQLVTLAHVSGSGDGGLRSAGTSGLAGKVPTSGP